MVVDGAGARQEFAPGPKPPSSPPAPEILPLPVKIVHPPYHDWTHSESSSARSDWTETFSTIVNNINFSASGNKCID